MCTNLMLAICIKYYECLKMNALRCVWNYLLYQDERCERIYLAVVFHQETQSQLERRVTREREDLPDQS